MRITIVTGFFLPVPAVVGGSTEKIWYGLAKIFASAGHSVTFVSRSWPGLARMEMEGGIRHIRLPGFDHTRLLAMNLMLDLIWGFRVARALPPGDVVICNTVTLPVWLHRLKPSAGLVSVMIGRSPKGQIGLYGGVARLFAPSTSVAGRITSKRASTRIRVTGYPIDWSLLADSARQVAPPVTVGFVGRLHPEKGLELLVRAACDLASREDLPEWQLRIVGPSDIREGGGGDDWLGSLQRKAATALGRRIEWVAPEFDARRLASVYGSIDVFCYPSLAERGETFGVAVAEAMAARCAVVVSALDCFSDLVINGQTGLVFEHASADSEKRLADCIGLLISDAGMRRNLAMRGQQHVKRYDYREVSQKILEDLALLTGTGANKSRESTHA